MIPEIEVAMFEDDEDDFRHEDARWEAENEAAEEEHDEEVGRRWADNNAEELAKEFFETNYEEAVRVFSEARLQSYYVNNPNVVVPALAAIEYARLLVPGFPQAALVFAVSSAEITLKYGILKPVIAGMIHAEELASLIAEEATSASGIRRYNRLLLGILNELTGSQFDERQRVNSNSTLWQEVGAIQEARNKLLHRGTLADTKIVELGVAVADTILSEVFPEILKGFGLHLHASVICAKKHRTFPRSQKDS
jgi:hypothetical protein